MVKRAPYGTWDSPITADSITKKSIGIDTVLVDPVTSTVYHLERRPSEGGRIVVVATAEGKDLFGAKWNARSGVQEYGGGAAVVHGGVLYFSNFADGDNRVYRVKPGEEPEAVTPENTAYRYADFDVHPTHPHLLVAILEDHTRPQPSAVKTSLVILNTTTHTVHPLLSGRDFYNSPRFSPSGAQLAWAEWDLPDMPWEGGEVHVAALTIAPDASTLTLKDAARVAGAPNAVSAGYPLWTGAGALLFTSDGNGLHFQNPSLLPPGASQARPALPAPLAQEFGAPAWFLGQSWAAPLGGGHTLWTAFSKGRAVLYVLDGAGGARREVTSPYVQIDDLTRVDDMAAVFVGKTAAEAAAVVLARFGTASLAGGGEVEVTFEVLKASAGKDFDAALFAKPEPITLDVQGAPLHVVYYPPTNPAYAGPEDANEKPPAVFSVHGGPTSMALQGFDIQKQFWTSRGWAWVDVNYGGSSGYGRNYCDRLVSNWGIVDVQDTIEAATQLSSSRKLVDSKRLCVRGGSAGGFTVLAALADKDRPEVFAAGTSSYGVSDLKKLAEDTHKFESRYLDKLVGGTVDEVPEVYKERSPVNNADRIRSPLLILQGSIDAVVPPAQAEAIVRSIEARGGKVEYRLFEGEGHGWRKAETIKKALEEEIAFYTKTLNIGA